MLNQSTCMPNIGIRIPHSTAYKTPNFRLEHLYFQQLERLRPA